MECVPDQFESWLCTFRHKYFYDIEAKKNVGIVEQPKPGECAARDTFLFLPTHCFDGPAEIFSGTRFHFDENKGVFLSADDVDLASAVSAEIAIKNLVTVLAQETAGQLFTERTASKMLRPE